MWSIRQQTAGSTAIGALFALTPIHRAKVVVRPLSTARHRFYIAIASVLEAVVDSFSSSSVEFRRLLFISKEGPPHPPSYLSLCLPLTASPAGGASRCHRSLKSNGSPCSSTVRPTRRRRTAYVGSGRPRGPRLGRQDSLAPRL